MSIPCYVHWKYVGRQTKDLNKCEQFNICKNWPMTVLAVTATHYTLQLCQALSRLVLIALLVLHQGVDGLGHQHPEDGLEVGQEVVQEPPSISERTFVLQVLLRQKRPLRNIQVTQVIHSVRLWNFYLEFRSKDCFYKQ